MMRSVIVIINKRIYDDEFEMKWPQKPLLDVRFAENSIYRKNFNIMRV